MREILLLLVVALVAAAIVFGVIVAITGSARGLQPAEPDERARRLPGDRPLVERDLGSVRFDAVVRGYRMAQVDATLRRVSYDLGYKQELIVALEAEVAALRDGRAADADLIRDRRLAAAAPPAQVAPPANPRPADDPVSTDSAPADDLVSTDSAPADDLVSTDDPGEPAAEGPGASAAGEDESDDTTAPDPDRADRPNGRSDGAARRIADQPAVS